MSQLEDAIRASMAQLSVLALYDSYRERERVADDAIRAIESRTAPQDDDAYMGEMSELRELRRQRRSARKVANQIFDTHAGIVARDMIAGGLL